MERFTFEYSREDDDNEIVSLDEFREIVIEDINEFTNDYKKKKGSKNKNLEKWCELYSNWLEKNQDE